jgi:hypothetical protein
MEVNSLVLFLYKSDDVLGKCLGVVEDHKDFGGALVVDRRVIEIFALRTSGLGWSFVP